MASTSIAACDSGVPEGVSSMAESSEESSEETPMGTTETVKIGKQEKQTVQGINQAPTVPGIYVYTDPAFDLTLAGEYTDIAAVNQTVVQIKEIKVRPKTDDHDYETKVRHIRRFLEDGDRCKVTVRFRGREMAHTEIGQDLLTKFAEECAEVAVLDKSAKMEGRHMSIFLSPKPAKDMKK